MSDTPYLFCLYAEDVRQELMGQTSIIGVFQGGLRVASVPAQIPKLAILANLRLPSLTAPTSVKLEVFRGDEVLQTIEPPADFFQTVAKQKGGAQEDGYIMQFVVGFVGFPMLAECKLEVRAIVDGLVLRGNALEMTVGESQPLAELQ